jgi:hypothetical protein
MSQYLPEIHLLIEIGYQPEKLYPTLLRHVAIAKNFHQGINFREKP